MKRDIDCNKINNIVKLLNEAVLDNISWDFADKRVKLSIYCYDNILPSIENTNNIEYDHTYLLINAEFIAKIEFNIEPIETKMLIHTITLETNEVNEYSFELKINRGRSINITCRDIVLAKFAAYNGNEYIDII